MKNRISKRARILKRVLKYINDDDFKDSGDHLVFGISSKSHRKQPPPLTAADEFLTKVSDTVGQHAGNALSHERTSLTPPSNTEDLLRQLDELAESEGSKFATATVHAYKEILTGACTQKTFSVLSKGQIDAVNRHYAEEVLDKLEKVVSRASRLQKLELKGIPKRNVQVYFEEAHRCYLYGFNVACAVMCRAILESALKARYDPGQESTARKPSRELPPNKRISSPILKWLDRAKEEKILDGSRVEAGENIKDAGDWAVHRPDEFKAHWDRDDELDDLVAATRKVVEDLNRATPAT